MGAFSDRIRAATAAARLKNQPVAPAPGPSPRRNAPAPTYPANDTLAKVERYVVAAEETRTSLAETYKAWTDMAFAMADLGESGRSYFHRVSRLSDKYEEDAADAKFTNALKTKNGTVHIGSFIHLCQKAGITLSPKRGRLNKKAQEEKALKALQGELEVSGYTIPAPKLTEAVVAAMHAKADTARNDKGRSVMRQMLNLPEGAATIIADTVGASRSLTLGNGHQSVSYADIRDTLSMKWVFFYDRSTKINYHRLATSTDPKDLKAFDVRDPFLNDLLNYLEENGTKTTKRKLEEAVFSTHCYIEINYLTTHLDYLKSHYKGEDCLAALLNTVKTDDDELFAVVFKKWLLNMVAQAYCSSSACRNEQALVLVSPKQGMGKTTFFQGLLWDDQFLALTPHFDFNNKEHRLMMSGHLLICWDEMGQYRKAEIDVMKAGLSQHVIKADKKFQNTAEYPRTASFCGSTNNDAFLKDATGSRRFLPFTLLKKLDFEAYYAVDKAQLLGQVVAEYKAGTSFRLTPEEEASIEERNAEHFTMYNPEDAFIEEMVTVTGKPTDCVSSAELEKMVNLYRDVRRGQVHLKVADIRAKLLQLGVIASVLPRLPGMKQARGYRGVIMQDRVPL